MIPCQVCGTVNRLGALYCANCGSKIDISLAQVQGSVFQQASADTASRSFLAGRNAIAIGSFLLVSGLILRFGMIPAMPNPRMPTPDPLAAASIFSPANPSWARITLDEGPGLTLEEASARSADLLGWRSRQKDFVLGTTAVNLVNVYNWQVRIGKEQMSNGAWPGDDPVASTGLALLAMQAYPHAEFKSYFERGWEFLRPRIVRPRPGREKLAQLLGAWALIDAGQLNETEIAAVRPSMTDGELPKWQTLALASFVPHLRPQKVSAIRSRLADPLWLYALDPYGAVPSVDGLQEALFTAADIGGQLHELDRVAWALAAYRIGRDPKVFSDTVRDWSQVDPVPPAPAYLRNLAGDHADLALAVLATTASLRTPIHWTERAAP